MQFKNQYLNVSLVSEMLNYSEQTIRRWVKEKKIPCTRTGRKILFRTEDLENWLLDRRIPSEDEMLFK